MNETSEGVIKPSLLTEIQGKPISRRLANILQRDMRIKQHTKLWYSTRNRLITCSDMAAVLGHNPYSSKTDVFKKKTGQGKPFRGNAATRRGTALEPEAIRVYERRTGKTVWPEDIGLMQHRLFPEIGGSPDGVILDGILVEIKCPMTRSIIPGVCPVYYIPQVQVLLEIFDLEVAHFVQFRPETIFTDEICDITVINRDRVWFAEVLPRLRGFVKEVVEFYRDANLPIGTRTTTWDGNRHLDIGTGKVCAFVYDKATDSDVFVIEAYDGSKVVRTEHKLIKQKEVKDEYVIEAQNIVTKQREQPSDSCLVSNIIANLPPHLRLEIELSHSESLVDYSDSEPQTEEDDVTPTKTTPDKINLDIEAITARMNQKRRRCQLDRLPQM